MRLERLFNVLVLQGAVLVSGCDVEPEPSEPVGTTDGETGEATTDTGPGPATAETGSETDAASEGTGSSGDEETAAGSSSGSEGSEGSTEGSGSTGEPLECSDPLSSDDPCGCPCCWIVECINTDPCCEDWSECAQG